MLLPVNLRSEFLSFRLKEGANEITVHSSSSGRSGALGFADSEFGRPVSSRQRQVLPRRHVLLQGQSLLQGRLRAQTDNAIRAPSAAWEAKDGLQILCMPLCRSRLHKGLLWGAARITEVRGGSTKRRDLGLISTGPQESD